MTASAHQLESLELGELVDRILAEHPGKPCITCSFQAEDLVVLHALRQRLPDIPVVFLETGYHFAETYAFRDRITEQWGLNLINAKAHATPAEQESEFGILYTTDPGRCCQLRKVEPLMRALETYDIWFTGLRREQSPTRRNLAITENHLLTTGKTLLKVSPLAAWTSKQVWLYTAQHGIESLPLYEKGYTSIGCEPCTSVPAEGADSRSGRWGGVKLECGIHTFSRRSE